MYSVIAGKRAMRMEPLTDERAGAVAPAQQLILRSVHHFGGT
jgi:hypothetical protein